MNLMKTISLIRLVENECSKGPITNEYVGLVLHKILESLISDVYENTAIYKMDFMPEDWWCPKCKDIIPPEDVTYEETHDIRVGGCGCDLTMNYADIFQSVNSYAQLIREYLRDSINMSKYNFLEWKIKRDTYLDVMASLVEILEEAKSQ